MALDPSRAASAGAITGKPDGAPEMKTLDRVRCRPRSTASSPLPCKRPSNLEFRGTGNADVIASIS
jgi:hypothetical protein